MPVASCSCLRLEDTGYVQKPLSAYDPKTHPLCLHPGDKPSLEPFPAPPLLVSPQGVSHCVGKKRWPNQAASQIEAALCLIRTTSERVERARGKEKQNETDD